MAYLVGLGGASRRAPGVLDARNYVEFFGEQQRTLSLSLGSLLRESLPRKQNSFELVPNWDCFLRELGTEESPWPVILSYGAVECDEMCRWPTAEKQGHELFVRLSGVGSMVAKIPVDDLLEILKQVQSYRLGVAKPWISVEAAADKDPSPKPTKKVEKAINYSMEILQKQVHNLGDTILPLGGGIWVESRLKFFERLVDEIIDKYKIKPSGFVLVGLNVGESAAQRFELIKHTRKLVIEKFGDIAISVQGTVGSVVEIQSLENLPQLYMETNSAAILARKGMALTPEGGTKDILKSPKGTQLTPRGVSEGYVHHLLETSEMLGGRLLVEWNSRTYRELLSTKFIVTE